ncbi:hypothetical protein N7532_010956 [Penicillium argentinense]|uniref:Apple domain-containing protein n=1 Tax=Penicillium argentinense TaxID=1131581 RepID=A0A9W9EQS8_9EURO|nr:uncharacterized protein N7532_010956 [Penicillium argentinense]KAJ5086185.1 hypothetical protein N7532_010956 [Penicillium argentinense]
MANTKLILPFALVALASMGAAQSSLPNDAPSTCPSLGGQSATVGGVVKVECDTWYNGYDSVPTSASTQQQCGEQCHASNDCEGSIWVAAAAKCYPIRQSLGAPQTASGYVTLRPDRSATPPTSCQVPAFKYCNSGGSDQVVQIGNVSMKKKCHVNMGKPQMSLLKVVKGLSQAECALICALNKGCLSAYHVEVASSTTGECQLQTNNIESQLNKGPLDVAFIRV